MVTWESYLNKHRDTGASVESKLLDELVSSLVRVIEQDKAVFTFGNGGSASTANHLGADLALLKVRTGTNCRAISLNTDLPLSTAISNDFDYKEVVSRQLDIFAKPKDIAIGFSASGNSLNIIQGIKQASDMGLEVWAIIGFEGGMIKEMPNVNVIHFDSPRDYGLIENLHMCLSHFIVDKLIETFK